MKTQFACKYKGERGYILKGIRSVFFFCIIFLSSLAANAQPNPVSAEFAGEWIFARAEAKERGTVRQINSAAEFSQYEYFRELPTRILFTSGFLANITNGFWENKDVFAATMIDYGLDFRETEMLEEFKSDKSDEPTRPDIDKFPVIMPVYTDMKLESNDIMSMQCTYSYYDASRRYIEGVLTVYYKR